MYSNGLLDIISPHYRSVGRRQGSCAVLGGSIHDGEEDLHFYSNFFGNDNVCPFSFFLV